MRLNAVWLVSLLGVGCNLFTATEDPLARDASVSDAAVSDAAERDGTEARDMAIADVNQPDLAPLPDGCTPEADEELCARANAACGTVTAAAAAAVDYEAEDYVANACGVAGGFVNFCNTGGTATITVTAAVDGDYRLGIVAEADLFGEVPVLAELSIDGAVAALIPIFDPNVGEYATDVALTAGDHSVSWRFSNDAVLNGSDRNLRVDKLRVAGPLEPLTDNCGLRRSPNCGPCAAGTCGLQQPNVCACACPLSDGGCAPEGPHPTLPCLECLSTGWAGAAGSCDTGDLCMPGTCDVRAGMCVGAPKNCPAGECQVATCSGGVCSVATAGDGATCGAGGVCMGGACGCPDGTMTETNCNDNNDNDCDALLNCADPDCNGRTCGGGRTCQAGTCQN